MRGDKRSAWTAFVLFVLCFAFRLVGIGWALPNDLHNQTFHPDETFIVRNYAYRLEPGLLKLTPGNYNYPTLYPLMLRVAGDMATTYSGTEQPTPPASVQSPQELESYLVKVGRHERLVNVAGRVISSLAGAGTAVVVFLFLIQISGFLGALFGGVLMGIAPAFLVHSRFQTVDVTSTFFFALALYYAVKILTRPGEDVLEVPYQKLALLSGLFAGLSAGTKYTGILALLALWTALAIRKPAKAGTAALFALGLSVVVFLLTTPGALLDTARFMKGVSIETAHMEQGHGYAFVGTPPGFIYQIGNLLTGIGPLAALIGLAGLIYGAARKRPWAWVLLAAILPYYLLIGRSQVKFIRYGLPLFPAVCIGFGYAVGASARRPRLKAIGVGLGVLALLGGDSLAFAGIQKETYARCLDLRFGGLYGAIKYTGYMTAEHPQDEAARYLKSQAAAGQCKVVGIFRHPWFWTVPVIPDANFLYTESDHMISELASVATNPQVQYAVMQPPADHVAWTAFEVDPLRAAEKAPSGIPDEQKGDFPQLDALMNRIQSEYTVEKTFGGDTPDVEDLMYIHPRVEVLKLK